ncbi:hypothetical protein D3C81_2179760 [compost metagenome]
MFFKGRMVNVAERVLAVPGFPVRELGIAAQIAVKGGIAHNPGYPSRHLEYSLVTEIIVALTE